VLDFSEMQLRVGDRWQQKSKQCDGAADYAADQPVRLEQLQYARLSIDRSGHKSPKNGCWS